MSLLCCIWLMCTYLYDIDPEWDPENLPPPPPYYWQEAPAVAAQVPWWEKSLQLTRYYGNILLEGGEAVGEVVASVLGLTESRFQYVVDSLSHDVSGHESVLDIIPS